MLVIGAMYTSSFSLGTIHTNPVLMPTLQTRYVGITSSVYNVRLCDEKNLSKHVSWIKEERLSEYNNIYKQYIAYILHANRCALCIVII